MWPLRKPKCASSLPVRKPQRKGLVTAQISPRNTTEYCYISKAVEGAQAGSRDVSVPGDRRLLGLCLLGVEVCLCWSQGEEPLSAGRAIITSVQNKTKMTSVKAVSLSDMVWIYNMWWGWVWNSSLRIRNPKSQNIVLELGEALEIRHRRGNETWGAWNDKKSPASSSSSAPYPPKLSFCNCKWVYYKDGWVSAYKSTLRARKCFFKYSFLFFFIFSCFIGKINDQDSPSY